MSTVPVNEEYVSQATRAVGDLYMAVKRGIGGDNTPGTALFELSQLRDMATKGLPHFGILDKMVTNPVGGGLIAGFNVTYNVGSDPYHVTVGAGYVGYQNPTTLVSQSVLLQTKQISIQKAFAYSYPTNYIYGVRLGIPISELSKATQTFNTTLSQDVHTTDIDVYVNDLTTPQSLGFPLRAQIGNGIIVFSGLNEAGTALRVDGGFNSGSGYGLAGLVASSLSPVYFIYQPGVQALFSLPVPPTTTNPANFGYFHPLPSDWLAVADILVQNPSSPTVVINGSTPAIIATATVWPGVGSTSILSTADASALLGDVDAATTQLKNYRSTNSISDLIRALQTYTSNILGDTQQTFSAYWASRPFHAATYFGRGVSFDNLERMEFSESFKQAYFDTTGQDLPRTFAMFRGDMYNIQSPLLSNTKITQVNAASYPVPSYLSPLTRGTYNYGISAVYTQGETGPTYGTAVANTAKPSSFYNELLWNNITYSSSNPIFFHIYRRSTLAGDVSEVRLTQPYEVQGAGQFTPLSLTSYPNLYTLSHTYEAIKFTLSGGNQIGGIGLNILSSGSILNTSDHLTVQIFADSSGLPPNTTSATAAISTINISYGDITVKPQLLIAFSSSMTSQMTIGSTYWIVITQSNAPSGATIQISADTTTVSSGHHAYSTNGSAWTAESNVNCYYRLFGYLDNNRAAQAAVRRGVRLTGQVALLPRRLRVTVPLMDQIDLDLTPGVASLGGVTTVAEDLTTQNEMLVSVTARNGATGTPVTFNVTIPQHSARGYQVLLGTATSLFDRVDDLVVTPGSNLTLGANNVIQWSLYDFITVECVP